MEINCCWGGESWGILCFSFQCTIDSFNGASVPGSRGGWGVEGVALGSYVVIAGEEG